MKTYLCTCTCKRVHIQHKDTVLIKTHNFLTHKSLRLQHDAAVERERALVDELEEALCARDTLWKQFAAL
jgi:hypothetical protein